MFVAFDVKATTAVGIRRCIWSGFCLSSW